MFPNLFQRKTDFLHDQDRVKKINLLGTIITVAVRRIHIGRTEQTDLIIEDQGLLGNILISRQLADGIIVLHFSKILPLTI